MGGKYLILGAKKSKKHNLQKWTLFSSIANRFRDMSNSLNSPFCHVVKITIADQRYFGN